MLIINPVAGRTWFAFPGARAPAGGADLTNRVPMRLALAMIVFSTSVAAAQPPSAGSERIVVWGSAAVAAPSSGGSLASVYSPVLELSSGYTSHAEQTLNVDRGTGAGAEIGVDVFLTRIVGIQAALVRSRASLSGSGNSEYRTSLRYIGMQPPDYVPREYTTENAQAWPDTTGSVSSSTLLVGGVVRLGSAGSRISGTLAGGVSSTRVDARVESLAYTSYRLGGHSVLFGSQHRVVIGTAGSDAVLRPYLAGQIGLRLNGRLSAVAGLRVEIGGAATINVRPDSLVDPNDGIFVPNLADAGSVLALQPMQLPMPRGEVMVGLRWRVR
jgi:hypothetical protein